MKIRYFIVIIVTIILTSLVSFRYNVVPYEYRNSTLLKLLNSGDYIRTSEEFDKWIYSGGKVLQGLIDRRAEGKNKFKKDFPLINK